MKRNIGRLLWIFGLFLLVFSGTLALETERAEAAVIVLDPGHGGAGTEGPGCIYPPYMEKLLTLEVASRIKDELSAVPGVTVYMTRTVDKEMSLVERALYAKSVGADLLISIHFNASGPHDKTGTEVWTSAFPGYMQTGYALGQQILSRFTALGFSSKGVKMKLGNSGDYYGIIRYGVSVGIPTVIVEQCFIDYPADRAIMASVGLSGLAHADAQGIISFLNSDAGKALGSGVPAPVTPAAPAVPAASAAAPAAAAPAAGGPATKYGFPIDAAGNVTYTDGSGVSAVFSQADWNWLLSNYSHTDDPEYFLKSLPVSDLQALLQRHAAGQL